ALGAFRKDELPGAGLFGNIKLASMETHHAAEKHVDHQRRATAPPSPTPVARTPAHPALALQRTAGNLAVQHLLRAGAIQRAPQAGALETRLSISEANDPFEAEADRVASQVISAPSVPAVRHACTACAAGAPCPRCAERTAQRKPTSSHAP